jgi:hypothetical protein
MSPQKRQPDSVRSRLDSGFVLRISRLDHWLLPTHVVCVIVYHSEQT